MPTDPDPHVPPELLLALARLSFAVTARDPSTGEALGMPSDGAAAFPILLTSAGAPATTAWAISSTSAPPRGFAPHVMTRQTFDILHGGTSDGAGGVLCAGTAYRVYLTFDGANLRAEARAR